MDWIIIVYIDLKIKIINSKLNLKLHWNKIVKIYIYVYNVNFIYSDSFKIILMKLLLSFLYYYFNLLVMIKWYYFLLVIFHIMLCYAVIIIT